MNEFFSKTDLTIANDLWEFTHKHRNELQCEIYRRMTHKSNVVSLYQQLSQREIIVKFSGLLETLINYSLNNSNSYVLLHTVGNYHNSFGMNEHFWDTYVDCIIKTLED